MHPNYSAVSINIPVNDPQKMDEFQLAMNAWHDEQVKHMQNVAKELGISESCANDVVYLRTRSRWSEELELELIKLHNEGNPPNIFDWP